MIIGDPNVKKSSTARALSGAYRKGKYKIGTASGVLSFYVQISALQESEISPNDFIQLINQIGVPNVLVTLRIDPANGQPDWQTYVREFAAAGWIVRSTVALDRQVPNATITILNSITMAANDIAHQLRRRWQWN
jgi:hypothetical protein